MYKILFILVLLVSCGKTQQIVDDLNTIGSGLVSVPRDIFLELTGLDADSDEDIAAIETTLQQLEQDLLNSGGSIIDPCGQDDLTQQIIYELPDGQLMTTRKIRRRSYLTVLPDGNYRTTDRRRCRYSIVNGQLQQPI